MASKFYTCPEAKQSPCPYCKAVPEVVVLHADAGDIFVECHVCHRRYTQRAEGSTLFSGREPNQRVQITGLRSITGPCEEHVGPIVRKCAWCGYDWILHGWEERSR